MEQIPDAPWIREAEQLGMPPYEKDPVCPICGENCTTIFMDMTGEAFACNWCLKEQDAWDWQQEENECNRPDWADK